ncbi:MAG: hypothetical protein H0W96_17030 [Solirubrobacterales bacterium]|nr:hypothetical protein [Solirubrobacterales bacterium]
MSDDSSHLTWYDDLPVREIPENIAKLDDDPRASRLSHEQRVTLVYESAIARVLLEQCERYDDLRSDIEFDGESFELLRTLALERARVIAELFLSARREDVAIAEHPFQGEGLLGAILALGVLKSCFVALTGDDPEHGLLLSTDELDALVLNPLMDAWWEHALPRDEIAPPHFGSGAPPPAPPPTDAANARAAVEAMAASVAASADDYVALLDAQPDGDRACEDALRLAREITALLQANFKRNIDFGLLDAALNPVDAGAVLMTIADSCVVLAAPEGDFSRYGMTAAELDDALSSPGLQAWQNAVAALP